MENVVAKKRSGVLTAVKAYVMSMMVLIMMQVFTIGASAAPNNGEAAWSEIKNFMTTWIPRLGGAVIIIGLVFFGLGWIRDDAESKIRGIQIAIGGAIVTAVSAVVATFMV